MRIVLLGHPVAHSISPAMQNSALKSAGVDAIYEAIDVPPGRVGAYVEMLRDGTYLGANVTVPYKVDVVAHLDELEGDALTLSAVNTIVVKGDQLVGYNTDPLGARAGLLDPVRDSLAGAEVLLLGAGGATRAVLLALARGEGALPLVVVAARDAEEAERVAALGRTLGLDVGVAGWEERGQVAEAARVIINSTALGLYPGEDPLTGVDLGGKVILDLVYHPDGTDFSSRAWREGAIALQGEEMLLHQGAASFRLWTGLEPPIDAMRQALRDAIAG